MNCARQREKLFHTTAAFLAVLAVLTFALAAIPAQAQTYKIVYNFGSHTNDPITPGAGPNLSRKDEMATCTA
jgi:hypothetical protein